MRQFYAKILLLGEYSILSGSLAITIPFRQFSARLRFPETKELNTKQQRSNTVLIDFLNYLNKKQWTTDFAFDFNRLEEDILSGLHFESTIPENYGLGSSGALVAAVADHYLSFNQNELNYTELKKLLAEAESFFHGKSSGIDPLSIYLNESLLFHDNTIRMIDTDSVKKPVKHFSLFDTNTQASTDKLVFAYLESFKNRKMQVLYKSYSKNVDVAVEKLIAGDASGLSHAVSEISEFQYYYFQRMIPENIKEFWLKGLKTGDYFFKLCGSGGGGYVLVFSLKSLKELWELTGRELIPVF